MNFYHGKHSNVTLIAVGLKNNPGSMPTVRAYYIKKKFSYNFVHSHLDTNYEVTDVLFLIKGKYLVTLVELEKGKKYYLSLWMVDKEKLVHGTEINAHVNQVELFPSNPRSFSLAGPNFFRLYKFDLEEQELELLEEETEYISGCLELNEPEEAAASPAEGEDDQKAEDNQIQCHVWLKEDNILLVCKKYKVYIFREFELEEVINYIYPHEELLKHINQFTNDSRENIPPQVKCLEYLVEMKKAAGGKARGQPIPKLIIDMGLQKLQEKRNWDKKRQEYLEKAAEENSSFQDSFNQEVKTTEEKNSNGDKISNPVIVKKAPSRKHELDLKTIKGRQYLNVKWEFFEQLPKDKLRDFLKNKDEEILQLFHYIYVDLMDFYMNLVDININCICKQDGGFAVGLNGCGIVSLFKEDKNKVFVHENSSQIMRQEVLKIHSLSSSFDNSHIAVVASIKAKKPRPDAENEGILDLFVFNSSLVTAIKVSYREPFTNINEHGPHHGPIKQIAISPTKSIMASLSGDRTLKFWNYMSTDKSMFSHTLTMNEQCFDMHPLLIQCCIGNKEGIQIFHLLENGLKEVYEVYTKSCKAIKYSDSGHLFAVGFINQIHIISPYRLKTEQVLPQLHSGSIIQLKWCERDKYLMSLCSNSSIIVWDTYTWEHYFQHYTTEKSYSYIHVDYDVEFDILVCCCSDNTVRFFKNKGQDKSITYRIDPDPIKFTQVLISKHYKVCFFGCEDGSVKVFLWPFIKQGGSKFEHIFLPVHQLAITDMKISFNLEHLITSSEDGSIYFLKINEIKKGKDVTTLDPLMGLGDQKVNKAISKLSNTYNMNEFAMLSSEMEMVIPPPTTSNILEYEQRAKTSRPPNPDNHLVHRRK